MLGKNYNSFGGYHKLKWLKTKLKYQNSSIKMIKKYKNEEGNRIRYCIKKIIKKGRMIEA